MAYGLKPMLLTEVWEKSILEDTSKMLQIKENGIRSIIHVKNKRIVGIRNRSNNPILYLFPELREIDFPFERAILDAEICVFKNGKSVFYGGIDKRRSIPSEKILKEYPATIVVFDVVLIDQENLLMKPYEYRYKKLEVLKVNDGLKVAKNFKKDIWDRVVKENLEGVVIKNPKAVYSSGKRSPDYLKLKNYKITDVIVEATEQNDKGTKVFGKANIKGEQIQVECQIGGVFDIELGTTQTIKYLDIYEGRLIQPTKVKKEQKANI